MPENTCFITGHRPHRFKFKYNEGYKLCIKIKKALRTEIIRQYTENNVRQFWVGGAIGVDCWAGEIILELKKQNTYHDMELFVALPFPEYDEQFDPKQKARWRDILKDATGSITLFPKFQTDAFKKRSYYMADRSQYGIAVYDNDKSIRSNTGMTVYYAQKKGLMLSCIHPDTAERY